MTELPLLQVRRVAVTTSADREQLMRRARTLAWGANLWHVIEFAIAVGAGVAAGSIALIGFGLDSLVEVAAGTVIVWLFTGQRIADSERAERRAQRLIAISFYLLGAYIAFEAGRDLIGGNHPEASWVGIGFRNTNEHEELRTTDHACRPNVVRARRRGVSAAADPSTDRIGGCSGTSLQLGRSSWGPATRMLRSAPKNRPEAPRQGANVCAPTCGCAGRSRSCVRMRPMGAAGFEPATKRL
jgi:hypothetical protein